MRKFTNLKFYFYFNFTFLFPIRNRNSITQDMLLFSTGVVQICYIYVIFFSFLFPRIALFSYSYLNSFTTANQFFTFILLRLQQIKILPYIDELVLFRGSLAFFFCFISFVSNLCAIRDLNHRNFISFRRIKQQQQHEKIFHFYFAFCFVQCSHSRNSLFFIIKAKLKQFHFFFACFSRFVFAGWLVVMMFNENLTFCNIFLKMSMMTTMKMMKDK